MHTNKLYSDVEANGWIPWAALCPIIGAVFVIGSVLPFHLLLTSLGFMTDEGDFAGTYGLLLFLLLPFALMIAIVSLWTCYVEKRPLVSIGLSIQEATTTFPRYLFFGIAMSGIIVFLIALAGGYQLDAIFPAWSSTSELGMIFLLLIGFCIQSSAEELLFRGWLLSAITRKSNLLIGITLSSLLFTLLHFDSSVAWYVAVGSFLFSVFACSLVLYTNNIWSAMGWHAGWNWFFGCGFEIPITGVDVDAAALIIRLIPTSEVWLNGGAGGPENGIINLIILAIGIGVFQWLRLRRAKT
ncbi:CPBP family intramembrane glutamic endopeptidase [Aliiglaciecola lipolytica]|uniref:CPBP family intramembrane glutamic endopeptidase n=1 Tax=Aliiglaciecola lipolytica TaxID=477689 RepID=UPI001C0A3B39|nr:CPBP family intramembrane glutamic endopeptidase [Aliiglaciecola lipolytica]MBU2878391.1 CPBP family intramembrane metalloprotease [Aliiglaciecola lipolytica]